jgi:YidC/Oxa1 family membrane protein insertase
LYLVQQKMVAARASVSPTMSPMQQKIMQYLPVFFAVFLVFYLTGLVIYYMAQAIFRIGLQWYITKRFYKGEQSLGRQAQAAGEQAREIAKNDPNGSVGIFGQAKREAAASKEAAAKKSTAPTTSKRVTPPKNKPTPSASQGRPPSSGKASRPPSSKPPKS